MVREVCPLHSDEDFEGVFVSNDVGYRFECDRSGHGEPFAWFRAPEPTSMGLNGISEELDLGAKLPEALAQFRGRWVEYGVLERAFALAYPEDWSLLLKQYGHTSIKPRRYTVSAFLAGVLGRLSSAGVIAFMEGPATGRWSYNSRISWWSIDPDTDHEKRLSWADSGHSIDYVAGRGEE